MAQTSKALGAILGLAMASCGYWVGCSLLGGVPTFPTHRHGAISFLFAPTAILLCFFLSQFCPNNDVRSSSIVVVVVVVVEEVVVVGGGVVEVVVVVVVVSSSS